MTASQPLSTGIDAPGGPGLLEGVAGTTTECRDAVIAGNRDVRSASAILRQSLDELHASQDDAWRSYANEVDRALVHLDAELQVAAARLRAERAESREDLGLALHEVAQSWRARIDDARVQARLAEMERHDAGQDALSELGQARTEVEQAVAELGHDLGGTLQQARHAATAAIGRVARAAQHVQAAAIPHRG